MSTCLGKMLIEEDQELAPNFKRIKLSSELSDSELARSSLENQDVEKEMKFVFPYLNDEKIKEILEKSDRNSESAKQIVHDMNILELRKNRNFINLHQENKKRRFNEMSISSETQVQNIIGSNLTNNLTQSHTPQRKLFYFVKSSQSCTDEDVDKIINESNKLSSHIELKEYLKKAITSLVKDKSKRQEDPTVNSIQKCEISPSQNEQLIKINEKLVEDNQNLKKMVVELKIQQEVEKRLKEKNSLALLKKIDDLKEQLEKEKSKNEYFAMILRQLENSNSTGYNGPDDIY